MNKIFKVIWNHATQSFVVTSELSRSKSKSASSTDNRKALTGVATAVLVALGATASGSALAASKSAAVTSIGAVAGDGSFFTAAQGRVDVEQTAVNGTSTVEIAIGQSVVGANATGGIAMGRASYSGGEAAIAIGQQSSANANQSFAMGVSSQANYNNAVALGGGAIAGFTAATNTNNDANVTAAIPNAAFGGHVAIGAFAKSGTGGSVAIGNYAQAGWEGYKYGTAATAVAIGEQSSAEGHRTVAIGRNAKAAGQYTTALGGRTQAVATGAVSVGTSHVGSTLIDSNASGVYSSTFGAGAIATAENATAVGTLANVTGVNATATGTTATASGENATARGTAANASAANATAEGTTAAASGENSTAKGTAANASAANATAMGTLANASAINATAIGTSTNVSGANSAALGSNNTITGAGTFVFGSNVNAATNGSVVLGLNSSTTGSDAVANVTNATVNGILYGNFVGMVADAGRFVSFGAAGDERKLINVAAGTISATSTEAINGSQLYLVANRLSEPANLSNNANGSVATPTGNSTGNFVNGTTVANVVNNAGWVINGNGANATGGANTSLVNPSDVVNFVNGTGTTVAVTSTDGSNFAVRVNANVANIVAGDNVTVTPDANGTYTISANDTNNITVVAAGNGTTVTPTTSGNTTTYTVSANVASIVAGDNVTVSNDNGTVTVTAKDTQASVSNVSGSPIFVTELTANDNGTKNYGVDVKIGAGLKNDNGTLVANVSNVVAGDNVTVTNDNGTVTVTAKDTQASVSNASGSPITVTTTTNTNGTTNYVVDVTIGAGLKNDNGTLVANVANVVAGDSSMNVTNNNGTFTVTANTTTLEGSGNGTIATPANGSNLVNASTVAQAINDAYWKVGNATGTVVHNVSAGHQVNFVNGTGTVANVTAEANGISNVSFDVKVDNSTVTIVDGNITTNNSAILANISGNVSANTTTGKAQVVDANGNPTTDANETKKAATVGDVMETINGVFHTVNSTNNDVQVEAVNGTTQVKAGDVVNFTAGKNLVVNQTGANITFGLSADVDVTGNLTVNGNTTVNNFTVNPNSTVNMGNNTVGGVANGTISNSSKEAVNGSQLYAAGNSTANIFGGNTTYNTTTGQVEGFNHTVNTTGGDASTADYEGKPATNIADAITNLNEYVNAGWKVGNATGSVVERIAPNEQVNFVNSNTTTATVVANDKGGANISFEVKVADNSLKVDENGVSANTTNLSTASNGSISVPAASANGSNLMNATEIANAINAAYHTVNSTNNDVQVEAVNGTTQVKAGDVVNFTAGKNLVVNQTDANITFGLSADVDVTGNLTVNGNTTVNNFTVNPNSTVNMGNNTVGGVANGTISNSSTEAVNGSQLYAAGNSTSNIFGGNTTYNTTSGQVEGFERELNTTGLAANENYTKPTSPATNITEAFNQLNTYVNAGWKVGNAEGDVVERIIPDEQVNFVNGTGTTATVTVNDKGGANVTYGVNTGRGVGVNTTTNAVEARVDNSTIVFNDSGEISANTTGLTPNDNGTINIVDGGNGANLVNASTVVNAINNASHTVKSEKTDTQIASGNTDAKVKPGSVVTYQAGKNLEVLQTVDADGNPTVAYGLSKDVNVQGDFSVNPGSNVDMGGNQIHNVAAGTADTDAVNVGQLKGAVNKVDKKLRAGIAGANAAAALPQVYIPGKSMVAASAGTFKGQSAVAVGYSRASDNGKLILKLQGNANTRGDFGAGVGVGYQW